MPIEFLSETKSLALQTESVIFPKSLSRSNIFLLKSYNSGYLIFIVVKGDDTTSKITVGTCLAKGCSEAVAADPDAVPPVEAEAGVDYSVNLIAVE